MLKVGHLRARVYLPSGGGNMGFGWLFFSGLVTGRPKYGRWMFSAFSRHPRGPLLLRRKLLIDSFSPCVLQTHCVYRINWIGSQQDYSHWVGKSHVDSTGTYKNTRRKLLGCLTHFSASRGKKWIKIVLFTVCGCFQPLIYY